MLRVLLLKLKCFALNHLIKILLADDTHREVQYNMNSKHTHTHTGHKCDNLATLHFRGPGTMTTQLHFMITTETLSRFTMLSVHFY